MRNQELYNLIENTVNDNIMKFDNKTEYKVDDIKYKNLVRDIEEVYLTHPDGPYKGSKKELKNDKEYIGKSLVKNTQNVTYYGDANTKSSLTMQLAMVEEKL